MNELEHKERHEQLHKSLDELVADFISHNDISLRDVSVMDLIQWSYDQTQNPTPTKG